MRVTFQDELAVSVGDDGLVILWKLQEVGVSKKEKETTFAEEILITKSDLEEKVNQSYFVCNTFDNIYRIH